MPNSFKASPNKWYRWKNDVRTNLDIDLLAVDSTSFPPGTGPKPWEIRHSDYYLVAWANRKYRMVYFNMGHNDMDYEKLPDKTLPYPFDNGIQNKLILNSLIWLGTQAKAPAGK